MPLTLKLTSRLPGCEKLRCSLHGETSIARPWKEDHRLGWRGQRGAGTAVTQQLGRALDFVDDRPVKTADESGGIGLRSGEDRLVVQRDVAVALLIHLSHERGFARPAPGKGWPHRFGNCCERCLEDRIRKHTA